MKLPISSANRIEIADSEGFDDIYIYNTILSESAYTDQDLIKMEEERFAWENAASTLEYEDPAFWWARNIS